MYSDNYAEFGGILKHGFKNQGDLDDGYHRIEFDDNRGFYIAYLPTIEFGDNSDSSLRPFNESSTGGFKYFIPPGTLYILADTSNEGMTAVSIGMRYRTPPVINTNMDPFNDTITNGTGYWLVLDDWINNDKTLYIGSTQAHNIFHSIDFSSEVTEEQAGWMYGNAYLNKTAIAQITIAVCVNYENFKTWYESYDWDVDSFGLQTQINECEGYPT